MDIYVSSLSMRGKAIEEIIEQFEENNFKIEFSSGLPYHEKMVDLCIKTRVPRLIHNYFPAPQKPFVLNLASTDQYIRKQSIEHCKRGIALSAKIGATFFAAHCGFCIDPKPEELGNKINQDLNREINKAHHIDVFYSSIEEILKVSNYYEVDFYIENNVITYFNLINQNNPLLGCESIELQKFFDNFKDPRFGLLLDTAHLKVSANTLGLNLIAELNSLAKYIKAIHHSDNDGLSDTNSMIDDSYWFLPHLEKYSELPQVLEVKDLSVDQIKSQISLLS